MNILLASDSRKGHTEEITNALSEELRSRGHHIEQELICPVDMPTSSWLLLGRCLPGVGDLLFSCMITPTKRYSQPFARIAPLRYPDVRDFDRIIIGGPKWMHLSFPIAGYLKQVNGLANKKVAGYTSFCGSPNQEVFEMYAYFLPFSDLVHAAGGEVIAQMGISSGYTDIRPLPAAWFRAVCRIRFKRPLSSYGLNSEWGGRRLKSFCDAIEQETSRTEAPVIA